MKYTPRPEVLDCAAAADVGADVFLDITPDICPITFVRTKLLLERMSPGQVALIRLKGTEPLENVPRSVRESGHTVISLAPEDPASGPVTAHRLLIRKS